LPAGIPKGTSVRIHFAYDCGGRLAVSAQVPSTRQSASTVIERKSAADLGDLASWKAKLTGTQNSSPSDSDHLRMLDGFCRKIAQSESGAKCTQFHELKSRIEKLVNKRNSITENRGKLQDLQTNASNRSETIELAGKLAKLSASEVEEDQSLAEEARKIIAILSS
jgi:hypothetical protein